MVERNHKYYVTVYRFRTNVQLYPTGIRTSKAIQCTAYWSVINQKKHTIWIPKSQIEEITTNNDGTFDIDITEWYVSNVLKASVLLD